MPSASPVTRRTLLKAAAATGAAAAVSSRSAAAAIRSAVFRHGVASGDPLGSAVILWTRVTPTPDATPGSGKGPAVLVTWELAADPDFTAIVRRGTVRAVAAADHTVKVDVGGLTPYTRYWYRFRALGATSRVGRTQTAPDDGRLHALRMAFVSCANLTGGYFSAYRFLAQRDDLDLVLFLGDYLYEYGNGADRYGPASLKGKRDHQPATEILSLADYRQRHAQYKADPDLQAAHAAHPWVVIFDDHEVANDTYATGAENHQPGEGDFAQRRARAYQVYLEWMPIRLPDQRVPHQGTRFWRRFSFGPLADLSVLETRQNRSKQVKGASGGLFGTDLRALDDPARVLLEPEQMAWLTAGLTAPTARWHLIGNQTVFARVALGPSIPGSDRLGELGLGGAAFNTDQWDGYQDDQRQVLQAMAAGPADSVVLTGDIHSSWANDLPLDPGRYPADGNSVGVEFVCPSITSDGFTEVLGSDDRARASTQALQATNPHIRYLDGIKHGFAVLDVTPQRVQADYWYISNREDPQATLRFGAAWQSVHGTKKVTAVAAAVGARSDRPRAAGRTRAVPAGPTSAAARPAAAQPTSAQLPTTGPSWSTPTAAVGLVAAGLVALRARANR